MQLQGTGFVILRRQTKDLGRQPPFPLDSPGRWRFGILLVPGLNIGPVGNLLHSKCKNEETDVMSTGG